MFFELNGCASVGAGLSGLAASDEPIALGCIGAFLLVVVLLLVWTFVIAPRRSRRLLQELEARGYVAIERAAPELVLALDSLAPILLEGSVGFAEGSRQTLNAMIRRGPHPRYLVNLGRTTEDKADAITIWQTVFLESRPLRLETEFSARSSHDQIGHGREERFGFQKVETSGLLPDFASHFSVYSKDGGPVSLSTRLQEALLEASRNIAATRHSNTRFAANGWGISAAGVWLDRKALHELLDAGERISQAL